MHYVYILYSPTRGRYYVGSCENLQTRLNKHNTNHSGFTGKTLDWKIMWSEEHAGKAEALKREKQIKTWKSRKMIENMIGKV